MKTSIKPTVGRIVLCNVCRENGMIDQLPGIVLRVFERDEDEYLVNVKVFGDSSNTGWSEKELYSVPIVDAGDNPAVTPGSFCEWMPYQKGQAAMTEAIAKKAGLEA